MQLRVVLLRSMHSHAQLFTFMLKMIATRPRGQQQQRNEIIDQARYELGGDGAE